MQRLWTTISILPSASLVSTSIALLNYFASTILGRASDFEVMRALGVKWRDVKKMVAVKASLLVILSSLIGTTVGIPIATNFLVPFPSLPPWTTLLLDLPAFGASALLIFLGSVYFSARLLKPLYKA